MGLCYGHIICSSPQIYRGISVLCHCQKVMSHQTKFKSNLNGSHSSHSLHCYACFYSYNDEEEKKQLVQTCNLKEGRNFRKYI